ncbi:MAG: hypothetical protein ABI851_10495 [Saprospiraceae bacterium]
METYKSRLKPRLSTGKVLIFIVIIFTCACKSSNRINFDSKSTEEEALFIQRDFNSEKAIRHSIIPQGTIIYINRDTTSK